VRTLSASTQDEKHLWRSLRQGSKRRVKIVRRSIQFKRVNLQSKCRHAERRYPGEPLHRSGAMDRLDHFPRVWCPTCNKVQPLIFDVLKANDKNEHDAADIICAECKSIIATLHAPDARRAACATRRSRKRQRFAPQLVETPRYPSGRFILGARRCGAAVAQFGKVVLLPAGAGFLSAHESR